MDIVSTKSVAALLGVSEATVKRWSDAGVLRCFKTQGGHRKFRLRDVRAFLNDESLQAPSPSAASAAGVPPPSPAALDGDARRAQALALAGDVDGLVSLVAQASESGQSYAKTFDRVIAPALQDIGARWACGEMTIPEEHTASAAIAEMLARLRPFAEVTGARKARDERRAVCACLGEEQHDIAVRMVAIVLMERGYRTRVVGAHVPALDLARLVGADRPGIVALSASVSVDPDALRADLAILASAAAAVKSQVIVGGAGFAKLQKMPGAVARHEVISELEGTNGRATAMSPADAARA